MKKNLSILLVGLTLQTMQGQDISDVLRFSQSNLNGTARFRAMSGAFGALGGDLSSIAINPAGSAVFINNQIGFTLTQHYRNNRAEYFGTLHSEQRNNLDLSQIGAVFVFDSHNTSDDWQKVTLGVNYENTNNFRNRTVSIGNNPTKSGSSFFVNVANGIPENVLQRSYNQLQSNEQKAFLAYQSFLINPIAGTNNYTSNIAAANDFYQKNRIATSGYNGKLSFNLATQYKNRFYFGLNLNSHFTEYRESTSFYEDVYDSSTRSSSGAEKMFYNTHLYTYGNGFSFQVGGIARVTNELRVGLTYESPTWYTLNDELSKSMFTYCPGCDAEKPDESDFNINPNFVNLYPTYRIQTPAIYTGSLAYIFDKNGLLSVDYALKNYSCTRIRPSNYPFFRNVNDEISNVLVLTSEVRLGAEYRIAATSLRAGYRYEQSPYRRGNTIGDLQGLSGGIGYSFGTAKLDLAYSYYYRRYNQPLFETGLTDSANIKTTNNSVSLTLLLNL